MAMSIIVRRELSAWIASVADVIVDMAGRLNIKPPIRMIETERNVFIMRMSAKSGKAAPPDCKIVLTDGETSPPALPESWKLPLRGSRVEVVLMPDRFLSRPLDLPKRAVEFLDAMVRSQLDRLTPWTANEALFGCTPPVDMSGERIGTTVIAAPKTQLDPLIRAAESWRAGSIVLFAAPDSASTKVDGELAVTTGTRLTEQHLRGSLDVGRIGRGLAALLVAAIVTAALSIATTSIMGGKLEEQQSLLSRRISERRAALRLDLNGAEKSALSDLMRRKQEAPANVLLLEALSAILPDNTYVTELRIEKDKLHIAGMTQDAPALVSLIERSAHFTHATFSAPTTRSADDSGERFHIEAGIKPHSGSGT
ncbi:putative general secretion pathway protein L [Bradyrhizobium oligotrophicum S58]|uniref:Putative general secretion pathway protein L n=1 Tax=Bradyrhizobium oligotrophicum S58 TaxID=1245469 RepID=M4Z425_9BRAD|nr:PilN domain-containing protein [Bradyrhizobium oligotrophicum]BAM87606.1 putative general secretion pathway protein L [Bradyrhizobium oligotrophicum S58]